MGFNFTPGDQPLSKSQDIRPGIYDGHVSAAAFGVTKSSGKECINVDLAFTADGKPVELRLVVTVGNFTFRNFLETFYPSSVGKAGSIDNPGELVGQPVQVVVKMSKATEMYPSKAEVARLMAAKPDAKPRVFSDDPFGG